MATAPIAVIAGDIANSPHIAIKELYRIAEAYERVLFVDGNHEHYNNASSNPNRATRMPPEVYSILRNEFDGHPSITYLDQGRKAVVIDDTAFIGANSWYDFNWGWVDPDKCKSVWYHGMNDSRYANVEAWWVENEAIKHASNITATVAAMNQRNDVKRIVLVSHTVPNAKGIRENASVEFQMLNGCYLNSVMKGAHYGKVVAHCFGHTHRRQMFNDCAIEFFANPRGYYMEPGFDKWEPMMVDLDYSGSAFGEME